MSMNGPLALGIDIGTSGVRVAALAEGDRVVAMARRAMPPPDRNGASITQDAGIWWQATRDALRDLATQIDMSAVTALAVDGTSGTIVPVDADGCPCRPGRLYNDSCKPEIVARIKAIAPPESAAHGATSALGRAIEAQAQPGTCRVLHQADWIAGCLSGRFDVSDENNALKTGYDPIARRWPDWIERLGLPLDRLPTVVAAGAVTGNGLTRAARDLGLGDGVAFVAGTTDGCAAFLATGADRPGEAVTSLGTTLVLKLLSDTPLFAPDYGLYSHRVGDAWLAGGASNAGGAALLAFFTPERMAALEDAMDPERPTGLDYYPLPQPGERFPIDDPALPPRVKPRPADDAVFLQGLLEGIAAVEALGYRRLAELGGPPLASVRSVGGGARNRGWSRIRERLLGVPFLAPLSEDAAVGTARLARRALAATPSGVPPA